MSPIANKYCFAGVVLEYPLRFGIPKRDEQAAKRIGVAVYVTNYAMVLLRHFFLLKFLSARMIVLALFASKEHSFINGDTIDRKADALPAVEPVDAVRSGPFG